MALSLLSHVLLFKSCFKVVFLCLFAFRVVVAILDNFHFDVSSVDVGDSPTDGDTQRGDNDRHGDPSPCEKSDKSGGIEEIVQPEKDNEGELWCVEAAADWNAACSSKSYRLWACVPVFDGMLWLFCEIVGGYGHLQS